MKPKSHCRHLPEAVQRKPQAGALRPILLENLNHVLVLKVVPFHYVTQITLHSPPNAHHISTAVLLSFKTCCQSTGTHIPHLQIVTKLSFVLI